MNEIAIESYFIASSDKIFEEPIVSRTKESQELLLAELAV